ncbi:MAG: helix-turn-helix domain-containing protein [Lachnospiraceae bacterium]|nr:helix-turn-helix domain-containing protein [Lachnospiraceae bacterium]
MEYLTVKEVGEKWGITSRMVNVYCTSNRIPGAVKKGNLWLIPDTAEKPNDNRYKDNAEEQR